MIRRIVTALLILLAAGWIGTLIARDPGYLLIAWDRFSLETSVWLGLLALVVFLLLLRGLLTLVAMLFGTRSGMRAWSHQRRKRRAQHQSTLGLLAIPEGDFDKARRILLRNAPEVQAPLINYLGAARAAHELGDYEDRDAQLQAALVSTPRATLAVGITQAELQIATRQWEQALATLLSLRKEAPRNSYVLRMLRATYEALEDWQALAALIPDLRHAQIIGEDEIEGLERRTWRSELRRAARIEAALDARIEAVEKTWSKMPKPLREDAELVGTHARELVALEADDAAETLLRSSLRHSWNDTLVRLYGRIASSQPDKQLVAAESWLSERPNSDALLLTLGRLCMRNQRWSKAREYLEASVRLHRSAEGFAELGRLCAHLGEPEQANRYFEDGLRLQRDLLPDLPLPAAPEPVHSEHGEGISRAS